MPVDLDRPICDAVCSKWLEQMERTDRLIGVLPEDVLDWAPPIPGAWPAAKLLGHLLECLAGCCAVLYAVDPDRLRHFERLRELPVNHRCTKGEARQRLALYRTHIEEGFALLHDALR